MRTFAGWILTGTLLTAAWSGQGAGLADFENGLECAHFRQAETTQDDPAYRQYAPSREIDIKHLALDVTPDFKRRTVAAQAVLTFQPIAQPLTVLKLDAVDLEISAVTATEKIEGWQIAPEKLVVTFAQPIPAGQEVKVTVTYSAEPVEGLYFRTPEMGYGADETHLFTQGEAIEARHWYPCYDAPNEKFTSDITCHVPAGMTVLSNGEQVSEKAEGENKAVQWRQDKPHVNYLITLVAGYFKKVEDKHGDLELSFYVPPGEIDQAQNSFRDTKPCLEFFEKEIGVKYPWHKYGQVVVRDFVAGGMENTSLTSLTDRTLYTSATENLRSSENLVAHELAHQWFGDLVTCKDWANLWLNEGFATFYALLYDEHKNGRDSMIYGLWGTAKSITAMTNDVNPIVNRRYDGPDELFNYLPYGKGSWVLNMLRSQLGADLYRRCIQTYLERHQYENVVTSDLLAVVEELSGRSYDRFFDQWVFHAHHPELKVAYEWDETTKLAKLSLEQTQKLSDTVFLFEFPLEVRFKGKFGEIIRTVTMKAKSEDFYFALPSAPETVVPDPNLAVLAKWDLTLSTAMWQAQLADQTCVAGRLRAVEKLADRKDQATVAKLKKTLQEDSFFGVRIDAARALQSIHTDEALAALLASAEQKDARVKRQVVQSIGGFYDAKALAFAQERLKSEKNPDIIVALLKATSAYEKPEVKAALYANLEAKSYRSSLVEGAIAALRTQDDPAHIAPVLAALKKAEAGMTARSFGAGLDALAYLARHEENKAAVREFLVGYVNHPRPDLRKAALSALGVLEDPQAAAVLETFVTASKDTPERAAAEKSLAAIRAAKRPTDNLRDLREEVLKLQKQQRKQQEEQAAWQKQWESGKKGTKSGKGR